VGSGHSKQYIYSWIGLSVHRKVESSIASMVSIETKGDRISTIGALSIFGIQAPFCFEGTLDGPLFLYYIQHFLLPYLAPGKVVVMDNASAHKTDEIIELIESTGAKILFLPPYCPEMNPIEYCWSKIKNFLKKKKPQTKKLLYETITDALKIITAKDIQGYFNHCGFSCQT